MEEARKRIENQMEKFRELEKQQKKITRVFYRNVHEMESKFRYNSDNSDEDDQSGNDNQSGASYSSNGDDSRSEDVN